LRDGVVSAIASRSHLLAVLSGLLCAAISTAQDFDTLLANTAQLHNTVSLDHSTYFPGEAAFVTFTVQNPTPSSLLVLAPFTLASGCLESYLLSTAYPPYRPLGESLCTQVDPTAPTTTFTASEQRQMTLSSQDPMFDIEEPVLDGGTVPDTPSYYLLSYQYPSESDSAAFEVAAPQLEASGIVQVQDGSFFDPASGATEQFAQYMRAFAVRWQSESYICVSRSPIALNTPVAPDQNGKLSRGPGAFVRVASSAAPVVSLSLTADAQYNLTITWSDSNGANHTLNLGPTPPPPASGGVQVGISPAYATLSNSATQQFATTVINSGNHNVTWTVAPGSDAPQGVQLGTVNNLGLYTAPSSITSEYHVIVTAQSQADSSRSAIAVIKLIPPITVTLTPATATIVEPPVSQTVQFTVTVANTQNTEVTWQMSAPTGDVSIDAGLYTAPSTVVASQTVTITATSRADPTKSASSTVVLRCTGTCPR
jgi:hypothetical protein